MRACADCIAQMQKEAEPPAAEAPAAAPAAEPSLVVVAVPMPAPRGAPHSKKVKLATGVLAFN